jgi:hypothetical protein
VDFIEERRFSDMKIEELQNDIISNEELLEDISYNIKNLIWLRTALEVMGFMECDRWNQFNSMTDELKRTYKEVQKDMLSNQVSDILEEK